jgi:hypothetical protein
MDFTFLWEDRKIGIDGYQLVTLEKNQKGSYRTLGVDFLGFKIAF